jgi:hypothetical protein
VITSPQPSPLAIAQTLTGIGLEFTRNNHVSPVPAFPYINAPDIVVIPPRHCGTDPDQPAAPPVAFDIEA